MAVCAVCRYDIRVCLTGEYLAMNIMDVYVRAIRPLPTADRLRLATLILNEIPPEAVADYSEEWSDEDYEEFALAGWQRVDESLWETDDAEAR